MRGKDERRERAKSGHNTESKKLQTEMKKKKKKKTVLTELTPVNANGCYFHY